MNRSVTPKLLADLECGEGSISYPPGWNELSALMRADLLKDWLGDLTKTYTAAVTEAFSLPEAAPWTS